MVHINHGARQFALAAHAMRVDEEFSVLGFPSNFILKIYNCIILKCTKKTEYLYSLTHPGF
jgi:hypothetical protein